MTETAANNDSSSIAGEMSCDPEFTRIPSASTSSSKAKAAASTPITLVNTIFPSEMKLGVLN